MKTCCYVTIVVAVLLAITAPASAVAEFRGLYVDAFHPGFKNHDQVCQMVSFAKASHFNALLVQVVKRGDAYYASGIEPRATDISADYDPLADIVEQAHAVGIQVHAWLSTLEVSYDSKWYTPGPTHVVNTHPEWLMQSRDGAKTFLGGKVYLDPGVPAVRDYLVGVIMEIVKNYDIDGIHLDNLRYPGIEGGYNPVSVARFNQEKGLTGVPSDSDQPWMIWRRSQITDLIRSARSALTSSRSHVRLSATASPERPQSSAKIVLADWDVWTREGIVDFVVPLAFRLNDDASQVTTEVMRSSYSRQIFMGLGVWQVSPSLAIKQIDAVRKAGCGGIVLYSYYYMTSDKAGCVKAKDLRAVFSDSTLMPDFGM